MSLSNPSATCPPRPPIRRRSNSSSDCSFSGPCTLGRLCLLAAIGLSGCSDARINEVVVKVFEPKRTPQQYMVVAFAAEDADERRQALVKVARSKQAGEEWAIKGYMAVALLDTDEQSRCVAIRALARTQDPRAAETTVKLLNFREYPPQDVRPPGPLCRWDATKALADLSAADAVPPELREKARATLTERLRADPESQVRCEAARGLARYPMEETLRVLISGLNDEAFAVVHQCEESLVQLTGYTHNCDALAWEEWLSANDENPFARAGHVPESRRPPYRNRLEKAGYDVKRFMAWLIPGRKE